MGQPLPADRFNLETRVRSHAQCVEIANRFGIAPARALDCEPRGTNPIQTRHLASIVERKPAACGFDPVQQRFELFLRLPAAYYHKD